jgi:hypothetical protein
MVAPSHLARDTNARDDLAGSRREYARVIGCTEVGCARCLGWGTCSRYRYFSTPGDVLGITRRAFEHGRFVVADTSLFEIMLHSATRIEHTKNCYVGEALH